MPRRPAASLDVPILVTGGLGFIGGYLVDELVASGATNIRVFDNGRRAVTPTENWPREVVSVIDGDIRDITAVQHATRGCKVVFHLAAQSNVMGAMNDPEYSCGTNVGGTLNVLSAARDDGAHRVVFTSSREVYGDIDCLPVPESAALHPKNLYGASKAAAELYCRALAGNGLEIAILRLANVYGPRDRDRVIPIFISNAMEGVPLTLYGGGQVLDFVWIQTVVDALLGVGFGDAIPHPLNVGSGVGTTVQEVAHRIIESIPSDSKCVYVPTRSLEVTKFVSDMTLAKKYLGLTDVKDPLEYLDQLIDNKRTQVAPVEY
jgi:UDP-glucose 4-epimerase